MNTEITDTVNERGWVLFDEQCHLCRRLARRCAHLLGRHRFALVPLQTPWVKERVEQYGGGLLSEMRLLTPQGALYGGADALTAIARQIWWAWPFYCLAQVPFVRTVWRKLYGWVARRRNCLGGNCGPGCDKSQPAAGEITRKDGRDCTALKRGVICRKGGHLPGHPGRMRSKRVFFEMP